MQCEYRLVDATHVRFVLPAIDPTATLVIDPVVGVLYEPQYFSYLGGSGHDVAMDIAVTTHGRATIVGTTVSQNFPVTTGAFDTAPPLVQYDCFAARLTVAGDQLVWATFFGGDQGTFDMECAYGVEVDAQGKTYVVGYTTETGTVTTKDFPTTASAVQEFTVELGSTADGFALKLNGPGTALEYSTLLSGANEDVPLDVAIDANGKAYVTGYTHSTTCIGVVNCNNTSTNPEDYPTTPGVVEPAARIGCTNPFGCLPMSEVSGFVTKLNATATAFDYSTFVRCESSVIHETASWCAAIALDDRNLDNVRAYVTGEVLPDFSSYGPGPAQTGDFPTTANAFQPLHGGNLALGFDTDAFVAGLDGSGASYVFASYLGGDTGDFGRGIAVSGSGLVWLTGGTASMTFPTTPFPPQAANGGTIDAYVTRVNPAAPAHQSLEFSSYLGGSEEDFGFDIWCDAGGGTAFVAGRASVGTLANFVTFAELFPTPMGGIDGFVLKVRSNTFLNATYLGGAGWDDAFAIAVDETALYLTGWSADSTFYNSVNLVCPVTGFQTVNPGGTVFSPSGFFPNLLPFTAIEPATAGLSPFVIKLVKP